MWSVRPKYQFYQNLRPFWFCDMFRLLVILFIILIADFKSNALRANVKCSNVLKRQMNTLSKDQQNFVRGQHFNFFFGLQSWIVLVLLLSPFIYVTFLYGITNDIITPLIQIYFDSLVLLHIVLVRYWFVLIWEKNMTTYIYFWAQTVPVCSSFFLMFRLVSTSFVTRFILKYCLYS